MVMIFMELFFIAVLVAILAMLVKTERINLSSSYHGPR